jgi:hypothetical protein
MSITPDRPAVKPRTSPHARRGLPLDLLTGQIDQFIATRRHGEHRVL